MRPRLISAFFLLMPAFAADEAPQWLREVATAKTPENRGKASAAVLFNEERVTVDATGRIETAHRYAVRILTR